MPIRAYADTSVFGGAFDPEFAAASLKFFDQVASGRFDLIVSSVIERELRFAPAAVRALLRRHASVGVSDDLIEDAVRLQTKYLLAGIVGPRWEADALHVAVATVAGCTMIVSWNFRHIVHFDKIRLYNDVNIEAGDGAIGIHSPLEVIDYEEDKEF